MKLSLRHADEFWADLTQQVDWYGTHATPLVAEQFVDAVEETLGRLRKMPGLGRARFKDWPELKGVHSFRVQKPYHRFLIFYRFNKTTLFAERLIYGRRDLPKCLLEPS